MTSLEEEIIQFVEKENEIKDTGSFAQSQNISHDEVVGAIKSLEALSLLTSSLKETHKVVLTSEGEEFVKLGSAEARTFKAIPPEGISKGDLEKKVGNIFKVGFSQAMKNGWIRLESGNINKKVDDIEDKVQQRLQTILKENVEPKSVEDLKKRKLTSVMTIKTFHVQKGPKFSKTWVKPLAGLTSEMILNGTWKTATFKPINFNSLGKETGGGLLHPLLKVRTEYRKIFLELGFEEMPTNNFVESSFWNFDSLFQPQQHPARDSHDTFFLSDPVYARVFPEDYLERVKEMHTSGGYGSIGWRYDWKFEESAKNILRTHTTAVSSRMLYKLAQEGFKPKKYFSIDKVFRNEAMDATHLAEFHQIEGLVADYNINIGHLMGIIKDFFFKLGITDIRFKPAYNPYTEPSMEVFSYHKGLGKWVEVGNSGVFRPEMLRPMGLPENVSVIAWGLSLERPTMIKYGLDNIRDLVGHKLNLEFVKTNPIVRLDK